MIYFIVAVFVNVKGCQNTRMLPTIGVTDNLRYSRRMVSTEWLLAWSVNDLRILSKTAPLLELYFSS